MSDLDERATFNPRTETVRMGDGTYVRMRELHAVLSGVDVITLKRLVTRAGLTHGVPDVMETSQADVVNEIIALVRGRPQFLMSLIRGGLGIERTKTRFEALFRDSVFGTKGQARATWQRPTDPSSSRKLSGWFYDSRDQKGDFAYFINERRKAVTLKPGQRFGDDAPYRECFLVYRDASKRFFLRWPEQFHDVPAYWVDEYDEAHPFFPHGEDDEPVDFEEIYPGYTYEVFGVQFSVPNLGVSYSLFEDKVEGHEGIKRWTEEEAEEQVAREVDARTRLFEILEISDPDALRTLADLGKHFRKLSTRYHPLKFVNKGLSDAEKAAVEKHYLDITNAYNALKASWPADG